VTDASTLVPPATTAKAENESVWRAFGRVSFADMIGLVWQAALSMIRRFSTHGCVGDALVLLAWGMTCQPSFSKSSFHHRPGAELRHSLSQPPH